MTKEAHFSIKASDTSRARCWRLTWHSWPQGPRSKRAPSNEWQRYIAPPKAVSPKERKRVDIRAGAIARYRKAFIENRLPVVDFTTTEAKMLEFTSGAEVDSTIAISKNNAKQAFSVVEESSTHLHNTMGSTSIGWGAHDAMIRLAAQSLLLACVIHSQQQFRRTPQKV